METISRSTLRKLTLTASLAAVYTVFRAIPISKLIGISGTITAAGMVAPIIGILLEPAYGTVAVFIGTMIASLEPGNPLKFYGLDFLPGALNVTIVSLAFRGRKIEATLMFLVMLGLFVINPYTRLFVGSGLDSPPIPYLWMHLVALVVLLSPLTSNLKTKLTSNNYRSALVAVAALAFAGTMIEHLTGGVLFASIVGKGAVAAWPVIFLAYPVERTVLLVGATLICTPLVLVLKQTIMQSTGETLPTPVRSVRTDP